MDIRHGPVIPRPPAPANHAVLVAWSIGLCLIGMLLPARHLAAAPASGLPAIPGMPTTPLPGVHNSPVRVPVIPGSSPANPSPAAGSNAAPKMASQEQAKQLFLKGTVTGEELKEELEAVKTAAANARSQNALAAIVGQASAQLASNQTHNFFT